MSATNTPVNPFCTGHGGARFELLVATYYVAAMVRDRIPRGVAGLAHSVLLQQRNRGFPVDDVIIRTSDGATERFLTLQVRHQIRFSENKDFLDVIVQCWKQFGCDAFRRDRDLIGIAISEISNISKVKRHLQELLQWARTSANPRAFYDKAQAFKNQKSYLEVFEAPLQKANQKPVSRAVVWEFLKSFLVIPFDFDNLGSRDSCDCWEMIRALVQDQSVGQAQLLFSALYEAVSIFARSGGEITIENLRRELPSSVHLRLPSEVNIELRDLKGRMNRRVREQIENEKNGKKYIPDLFTEISNIKERVRKFSHPSLFLVKTVESIRRIDFKALNRNLEKVNLGPMCIELDNDYDPSLSVQDIQRECAFLTTVLKSALRALSPLTQDGYAKGLEGAVPDYAMHIFSEIKYLLYFSGLALTRQLEDLIEELQLLAGGFILIVDEATKGETNFVCDFAETFLIKHGIPCIYLTGKDLVNADLNGVEQDVFRVVTGLRSNTDFKMVMDEVERLCRLENKPLTIIIDGLNEHPALSKFSVAIEQMLDRLAPFPYLRFIMTCRSEYFEHCFGNLVRASFANRAHLFRGIHACMGKKHKERMLDAYFGFFNISFQRLFLRTKKLLEDNPFVLRIFCETYGDHMSKKVKVLPSPADIYKASLFRSYLDKKLDWLHDRHVKTTNVSLGVKDKYKSVLRVIMMLMINKRRFGDIALRDIDQNYHQVLEEMIHEGILLRKDLRHRTSALDDPYEVLNITFDEFRDFLVADYLISTVFKQNRRRFETLAEELTKSDSPIAEGLRRFLFYEAKRSDNTDLVNLMKVKSWHKEIFLKCIFSIEDEHITKDDLSEIVSCFREGVHSSSRIMCSLIPRYNTTMYPVLNIRLLFDILDTLDDNSYRKLVSPVFDSSGERYGQKPFGWPIENLSDRIVEICRENGVIESPHVQALAELLPYLFEIRGEEYHYPARKAFRILYINNREIALSIIRKHLALPIKQVAIGICYMMRDLVLCGEKIPRSLKDKAHRIIEEDAEGEEMKKRLREAALSFIEALQSRQRIGCSKYPWSEKLTNNEKTAMTEAKNVIKFMNDHKYLIVYKPEWTIQRFRNAAKVLKRSYAEELTERIYGCLFGNLVNVQEEYDRYYSLEYADFEGFLYSHYDLGEDYLDEVITKLKEGFRLGYGSVYSNGDYTLGQMINSALGKKIIEDIFRVVEGKRNEN